MPTFTFTCIEHGDVDHDSRDAPVCFCGELMKQVFTVPYISVAATPTSRPRAHAALQRERDWGRDMAAYKRFRDAGEQPARIDGSADLEARAQTKTELAMGEVIPLAKVREGAARSAEVLGHDVEV